MARIVNDREENLTLDIKRVVVLAPGENVDLEEGDVVRIK